MQTSDWVGFIGVAILLLAFVLNLLGRLSQQGSWYSFLNTLGAGLACLASVMMLFWPFIILEGVWTAVSLWYLIRSFKSAS